MSSRPSERLLNKAAELKYFERKMNQTFGELAELEAAEGLTYEGESRSQYSRSLSRPPSIGVVEDAAPQVFDTVISKDLDEFLANPKEKKDKTLKLKPDVAGRIQMILDAGLSKYEERKKLMDDIPREGDICVEAPILNQEIVANLNKDEISRDNFFVQYQNMLGASISAYDFELEKRFCDSGV
ncbi:hypothetical protein QAD02_007137 [Eretmocerus hayati]|uniref:Uncharacterized protein n=1 Tax=Eretmocerus hayati TaxID=131215 RepID=A0ACC2N747_9HYME|nr:hypothetical protein QAD02_007137 [Eretmocerus hayati]